DQRRLLRHLWQARIGAHQEILARITRPELGAADVIKVAVRHVEQRRFGGDLVVELVHHFFFELVRLLRQRQRPRRGVRSHTIAPDSSGGLAANCPTGLRLSTPNSIRAKLSSAASAASGHEWAYHL